MPSNRIFGGDTEVQEGDVLLDLGNQIKRIVIERVVGLVTGPSPAASPTPTRGRIVYNDTVDNPYIGDGARWLKLIPSAPGTITTLGHFHMAVSG